MKIRVKSDRGFVIPFCGFMLIVLFGMASFAIDIGNARYQLRNIQVSADAASMAGLLALGPADSRNAVVSHVRDIATRNGILGAEMLDTDIDCGTWIAGNFIRQTNGLGLINVCNAATTAIRVSVSRNVNTFFGRVLNFSQIRPTTLAVATKEPLKDCAKPFGVSRDVIYNSGLSVPFTISLSTSDFNSGNWGKLDFPGMSGGNFDLSSDVCEPDIAAGKQMPTQPGNPRSVMDAFNALNSTQRMGMTIVLTSPFATGRSDPVTMNEFAKIDYIGSTGNGSNFTLTLRVVALNVNPNPDPVRTIRALVK